MGFAQNTLVKWFNADFSATPTENHVIASPLTSNGGIYLGNISPPYSESFFQSSGWPQPVWNVSPVLDPLKYLQFKVAPEVGFKMNVNKFQFIARTQGTPSLLEVRYSKSPDFSTYSVLQTETELSSGFTSYELSFPANTIVNSGQTLYIRLYVYKTNNEFHLKHNQTGSISPTLFGDVSLEVPIKPVVEDDTFATSKNSSLDLDILNNDEFRFSGSLLNMNATKPTHGTVVVNSLKDITYTPNADYVGYDSFYYTLTNAVGKSENAKVEIQVVEGKEEALVKWHNPKYLPHNYAASVLGSEISVAGGVSKQYTSYNEDYTFFEFGNLPNPGDNDKLMDYKKFIQFSVSVEEGKEVATLLKKIQLTYRGNGSGNITISYSKTADFSKNVHIILNNQTYDSNFVTKDLLLSNDSYVSSGETIYFRIYAYNTNNTFHIKLNPLAETGLSVFGVKSVIHPEPCIATVIWDGEKWNGGMPTIYKKAVIAGDYFTASKGSFSACSCTVNEGGKLIVGADTYVEIGKDLTNNGKLIVESNGNLVQIDNVSNTTPIAVRREHTLTDLRKEYIYLSSPVAEQNMKMIFGNNASNVSFVTKLNEPTNVFVNATDADYLIQGKGFAVKEPRSAGFVNLGDQVPQEIAQYNGIPNNGDISIPLSYTQSRGYNLVGNPYPSNIDIVKLYEDSMDDINSLTPNIDPTFRFWDNKVNATYTQMGGAYQGYSYALFNAKSNYSTAAPGLDPGFGRSGEGRKAPGNIIKVSQAFMIRALKADAKLKFNNTMRDVMHTGSEYYGRESEKNRFRLQLRTQSDFTVQNAITYISNGNKEFGLEDTRIPNSQASDALFSFAGDAKVVINGRSTFTPDDVVVLGLRHFTEGIYTIQAVDVEGVFANGQQIYLKDKQLNIFTNLSAGDYTFTSNAGEFTNRFEIVYKPEVVLATDATNKSKIEVYRDAQDFVVKSADKTIENIELYDAVGRLVFKKIGNSKEIRFDAHRLAEGMYIVKAELRAGEIFTKKIRK